MKEITKEKVEKYFKLSKEAFAMASENIADAEKGKEILDFVSNYISDAEHFFGEDHYVNALAALSYAHGWLDCGARLGIFSVKDNRLFVVDGE